jgi:hypothetical protein
MQEPISVFRGSRTMELKLREKEVGYPPIRIIGQKITKSQAFLQMSSQ